MQEHQGIIRNVGHVMEGAVKVNVYLKNIDDLAAVEDMCALYFTGTPAFAPSAPLRCPWTRSCRSAPSSTTPGHPADPAKLA